MKTSRLQTAWYEGLFFEVISVIMDGLLGRSPAGFKLDEALVFGLGPSKTKTFIPVLRVPLYGFPHDEIVWPQVMEVCIRSSVFENRLLAKMEIDRPCDIFLIEGSKNNHSKVF